MLATRTADNGRIGAINEDRQHVRHLPKGRPRPRGRLFAWQWVLATVVVVLLGALTLPGVSASAAPASPECTAPQPDGPMWITADCVDPTR